MIRQVRRYALFSATGMLGIILLIRAYRSPALTIIQVPKDGSSPVTLGLSRDGVSTAPNCALNHGDESTSSETVVQVRGNSEGSDTEVSLVRNSASPSADSEKKITETGAAQHEAGTQDPNVTLIASSFDWQTPPFVQQPTGIRRTNFWLDLPVLTAPNEEDFRTNPPTPSGPELRDVSHATFLSATAPDRASGSGEATNQPLKPIPDPGLESRSTHEPHNRRICQEDTCRLSDFLYCDPCRPTDPWKLPTPQFLACRGWEFGGWVSGGISVVANNPADNYNGVVTFNDRDREFQMNQLNFYLEKVTQTNGCGWDWGGRVDVLYGTDARFTQAIDGLESDWNQTERFYQVALPQFYLDLAYNDWLLRAGHFYSLVGYEAVPVTQNFFYSHSYSHQYGQPFTHTGLLLSRKLNQWVFTAGLQRGNDQFDDTDGRDAVGFLGGIRWTSYDERFAVAFGISADEQGIDRPITIYSLVGTWNVTSRLQYVVEHTYGESEDPQIGKSQWYGLTNYLYYKINPCWQTGLRVEWFRDEDGVRVAGVGDGNRAVGPYPGDFYEISLGLNWSPHPNLRVRPEVRWDWFDERRPVALYPYDAGDRDDQFLLGCDFIVTF